MKIIAFVLLLLISLSALPQTCIIVRKEDDRVIAVADTKITYLQKDSSSNSIKLGSYKKRKICFAAGGIFFNQTYKTAMRACKEGKTFKQVIDSFAEWRGAELTKQFDTLRSKNWMLYEQRFDQQPSSGVIFFGYEKHE